MRLISSFPENKAAGPDGFSVEFFQVFGSRISPLLLHMLKHSRITSSLPPTQYKDNMSLILKPGHDPKVASLHRPISLLPIEIKIIGKVLASRLKECTGLIIHSDQTSFMPGRHTYRNLRCLFDILYTKHTEEAAVISLNAQCAFDQVEWPCMMFAHEKFGFGPSFMKWIEIIFSHPTASVITNQNITPPFAIHRGTRQGCPLSPFLFAIIIEPLAASIRQSPLLSPIDMYGHKHHPFIYVKDVLLYVSNPQAAIHSLMTLIYNFGSLSGFSIYWDKSELMPISTMVYCNHGGARQCSGFSRSRS